MLGTVLLAGAADGLTPGTQVREGSDFTGQGELLDVMPGSGYRVMSPLARRLAGLAALDSEALRRGWLGTGGHGYAEYPWWRVELWRSLEGQVT